MKTTKTILIALLLGAAPFVTLADDAKPAQKPKPYTLKTCPTDDEKLGSMGTPYTFVHEGREIKLCCSGCLDDFKKDPAKYIKKIEAAEKKEKK
jgi:YHS domain-containing protein